MRKEVCKIEFTLVPVPLRQDQEEAYWQAMDILADLIRQWIEAHPQLLREWLAASGEEQDAVAVSLYSESGDLSEVG